VRFLRGKLDAGGQSRWVIIRKGASGVNHSPGQLRKARAASDGDVLEDHITLVAETVDQELQGRTVGTRDLQVDGGLLAGRVKAAEAKPRGPNTKPGRLRSRQTSNNHRRNFRRGKRNFWLSDPELSVQLSLAVIVVVVALIFGCRHTPATTQDISHNIRITVQRVGSILLATLIPVLPVLVSGLYPNDLDIVRNSEDLHGFDDLHSTAINFLRLIRLMR